jgi:hypothetical protein
LRAAVPPGTLSLLADRHALKQERFGRLAGNDVGLVAVPRGGQRFELEHVEVAALGARTVVAAVAVGLQDRADLGRQGLRVGLGGMNAHPGQELQGEAEGQARSENQADGGSRYLGRHGYTS